MARASNLAGIILGMILIFLDCYVVSWKFWQLQEPLTVFGMRLLNLTAIFTVVLGAIFLAVLSGCVIGAAVEAELHAKKEQS